MTKKEIVEKLKNEMPNFEGSKEEIEIKTALYIYVELAKMKAFDERYFFGNSKLAKRAYNESLQDAKKPDNVAKKRKITCVSLSHLYKAVLADFGIESSVKRENPEDNHVFPIIKLKTGKELIADIQADMEHVQTKSRLQKFEPVIKEDKNFDTELTKMLIEIGYINSFNDYRDEKVESILKSIEGLRANEALSTILKSEDTYKGMEGIGIVEAYKYYKTILRKVINKENYNNKIFCFQCHKSSQEADGIEKVNYSICAYSEEPKDNVQLYLFSAKEGRFLECDLLKLDELQKQGLVLGKTGRENGIRKLKKIIKNEKTQSDENTK